MERNGAPERETDKERRSGIFRCIRVDPFSRSCEADKSTTLDALRKSVQARFARPE